MTHRFRMSHESDVSNAAKPEETALRGTALAVFTKLLAANETEKIIELFAKLALRNQALEMQLAKLRVGNKSERVCREQLDLFLQAIVDAAVAGDIGKANEDLATATKTADSAPEATKPPAQPTRRPRIPAGLRHVPNDIPIPQADRACPKCGAERRCIHHEVTHVIDLLPAEVIVRVDRREILSCTPCDGEMVRAEMGDKVVTGGLYGSSLVAELVVNKYSAGLPLYRQGEMLCRMGLVMPSATMSDQICWAADLLEPLWSVLKRVTLTSRIVHADATGIPARDRETMFAVQSGSMWGFVGTGSTHADQVALYLYTSTGKATAQRAGEIGPIDFLLHRKGPIVADAAGMFDVLYTSGERVEIGCNMHARRYFVKAFEAGDARAAMAVKVFGILYDVEASVKGCTAAEVLAARRSRSRPIYDELLRWQKVHSADEPPKSLFAAALRYLRNQSVALTRFLDDGSLPIDNGPVERLHRRVAVGRKNFLFVGSHAGGRRAAIAYSILGTCSLLGVNPNEYLRDVLPILARGGLTAAAIAELMPAAWLAARPQPQVAAE